MSTRSMTLPSVLSALLTVLIGFALTNVELSGCAATPTDDRSKVGSGTGADAASEPPKAVVLSNFPHEAISHGIVDWSPSSVLRR
jgi:hypothetical protein